MFTVLVLVEPSGLRVVTCCVPVVVVGWPVSGPVIVGESTSTVPPLLSMSRTASMTF